MRLNAKKGKGQVGKHWIRRSSDVSSEKQLVIQPNSEWFCWDFLCDFIIQMKAKQCYNGVKELSVKCSRKRSRITKRDLKSSGKMSLLILDINTLQLKEMKK